MEKWYMVFNIPPHKNGEVPLYFFRKLYAEFVMGKHVNYFDMLGFQGVGRGMPQHWPNAIHDMVSQTHEAFFTLAKMISWHMTTID